MRVTAEQLDTLRHRTSEKWVEYPPDVLPLFVAEMDYPLAEPVQAAIIDRVRASDTGYVSGPGALPRAFADFAERRWSWRPGTDGIRTTTDVSVAIVETLRQVVRPGEGVVITPPVYPPFFDLVPEAGGTVVEVPLRDDGATWSIDLDGLERAFSDGARAFLLCNPQNPLGLVHDRQTLEAVAELSARYDVAVVSDEIHAPLVRRDAVFTPYLSVSDAARERGIVVTAASKGWNLAGVKCALFVAGSERTIAALDRMPAEVGFRTSLLGLHASVVAFDSGEQWLDGVLDALDESRTLLGRLLEERMPGVAFRPPAASYLAWLDFRAVEGWAEDPAAIALERGVALIQGSAFGAQGAGHARLNFACHPDVLTEAIDRMAR